MAPTRTHYKLDRHNCLAKQPVDLADDLVRVRNCYRDGQNIHMNRNDTQKPRPWLVYEGGFLMCRWRVHADGSNAVLWYSCVGAPGSDEGSGVWKANTFLGRDRDARVAPTVAMPWEGGVLQD